MSSNYQFGLNIRAFLEGFLSHTSNNDVSKEPKNTFYLEEPVFNLEDIQGNILLGFNKPFQQFIFFRISSAQDFSRALKRILPKITDTKEIIEFRKQFRKLRGNYSELKNLTATWLNIAFTFNGLKKLLPSSSNLSDNSFKAGFLHRYKSFINDETTDNWGIGGKGKEPDVLFILAADLESDLEKQTKDIINTLNDSVILVYEANGVLFSDENRGKEHFGFKDGISQPGVRGRLSDNPTDFLIRRKSLFEIDLDEEDQDVIWPGEFVFGYSGQDTIDYVKPGRKVEAGTEWGKNSSYLVFIRFTQDVKKFKDFLKQASDDLKNKNPSFSLSAEQLAAKLMGRTFEGEPLTNNDVPFLTSSTIHRVKGKNIDQRGLRCPFAAHIRKSYPKSDIDTAELHQHRILRRGIPFGDPTSETDEKGLLFLSYQTSIEKQFEHLFFKWMNDPNFVKDGTGKDPILGFSNSNGAKTCSFKFPIQDNTGNIEEITLELPSDIINLTGGEYFFSPSISALSMMVG